MGNCKAHTSIKSVNKPKYHDTKTNVKYPFTNGTVFRIKCQGIDFDATLELKFF